MADVRTFLRQLIAELDAREWRGEVPAERAAWLDAIASYRKEWETFIAPGFEADTTPISPQRAAFEIDRVLPDDAILVSDIGVHHNWLIQFCKPRRADSLIGSMGFGPMGFGVAVALYVIDANIGGDLNPGGAGVWELPSLGQSKPAIGKLYVPE
ncbi:MAG: hypothetical protein ACM3SS_14360 [Rhodospirillaceae bacterium]